MKDLPLNNQVENSFFHRISNISVTCPHAQPTARAVIEKSEWTFSGLGVEITFNDLGQALWYFCLSLFIIMIIAAFLGSLVFLYSPFRFPAFCD